jgi:hypothetical protein
MGRSRRSLLLCALAAATTITAIRGSAMSARQRPGIPSLFSWITIPLLAAAILGRGCSRRSAALLDVDGHVG